MRTYFSLLFLGTSVVAGCGSDDGGDPAPGTGGAGGAAQGTGGVAQGTGGATQGTGGAAQGTGGATQGTGGATQGTGGKASSGPNQYPQGEVTACFGDCPKGECDNDGFWSDIPCSDVYTAPVNSSSAYCGSGIANYCLDVGGNFGDTFGVQCAGGQTTIRLCPSSCGTDFSGFSCD